jgi:hypothetical protein
VTIQDLGALGELLGGVLILASVIYLAIQVSETKKQIAASTAQARSDAFSNMFAHTMNPVLLEANLKAKNDPESLTESERQLLFNFLILFLNHHETTFYHRKLGTLDPAQAGHLDTLPILRDSEFYANIWRSRLEKRFVGARREFAVHVNAVIDDS